MLHEKCDDFINCKNAINFLDEIGLGYNGKDKNKYYPTILELQKYFLFEDLIQYNMKY